MPVSALRLRALLARQRRLTLGLQALLRELELLVRLHLAERVGDERPETEGLGGGPANGEARGAADAPGRGSGAARRVHDGGDGVHLEDPEVLKGVARGLCALRSGALG